MAVIAAVTRLIHAEAHVITAWVGKWHDWRGTL